uniref:mannosyl-oligosaccharide 1,2-alpha-mannosidase n=1 Tax=Attheya septentrionalis TaxID=420275 RepID=A0A7S2XQ92_9STRA|mmetsp:Transcript_28864/g.52805  ORF Transcript_28864/g.52805 Transcript_28864/m.52805 type:complete len:191 (+) Transcript_28864:515-1087(+)
MGWEVFESLELYCKTDLDYTGFKDVYGPEGGGRVDDMPSYFIAEILKYLLLLFGPDDFLLLNDFVFTTGAHPMRRTKVKGLMAHSYIQAELSNEMYVVRAPFPWYLFGALVLVIMGLGVILVVLQKGFGCEQDAMGEDEAVNVVMLCNVRLRYEPKARLFVLHCYSFQSASNSGSRSVSFVNFHFGLLFG